MIVRHCPLPHHGSVDGSGRPLAGQEDLRFSEVLRVAAGGGTERLPISELDRASLTRLTAPRPALCGLSLHRPRIMGILNVTPDSFSDGGDHASVESAVARARTMAAEVDILDIGGESTRPGAEEVPREEEIRRTAPVIRAIRDAGIQTPISIDTRKAPVAAAALEAGADMINDVSALTFDAELGALAAETGVPICLMHAQGLPETMQRDPRYGDVLHEVIDYLGARIDIAVAAGIRREKIIADPGIGFGKTVQHNLTLLRHLAVFHDLGVPILLGASRKRFIGALTGAEEAKDRLGGSLAVALHAAGQGVQVIRVHDTHETAQALRLQRALAGG